MVLIQEEVKLGVKLTDLIFDGNHVSFEQLLAETKLINLFSLVLFESCNHFILADLPLSLESVD